MRDLESGWWVIEYTEFAAKAVEFLLFELYDIYGPWCLSSKVIANIRCLDLIQVLGCMKSRRNLSSCCESSNARTLQRCPMIGRVEVRSVAWPLVDVVLVVIICFSILIMSVR